MNLFNAIIMMSFAALANVSSTGHRPQQVSRIGSFDLPCSADTAFPLFSPEGEREWIKEWNPRPVFPEKIEFSRDTVFAQGAASEEAVWTILDADWQGHRAEYVRVVPGSHTAHIVVNVEPLAADRSRVTVSYTVTAFGPHGDAMLRQFSEDAYAVKMGNWQRQIIALLETRNLVNSLADRVQAG
jgi:hypothetical protein